MPIIKLTKTIDVYTILGKRQSGKSYYLKRLIDYIIRMPFPFILWDYKHEHIPTSRHSLVTSKLAEVEAAYRQRVPFIYFRPRDKSVEAFEWFNELIYTKMYNRIVIYEELNRYATSHKNPYFCLQNIRSGSGRGLGFICTSQRAAGLHNDILANSQHIIIFRTTKDSDLKSLADDVGEGIFALPRLPRYAFFHWSDYTGQLEAHPPLDR